MNFVPSVVTQNLGKASLLAQKSSPEVLLAAGVVGMVASTVLACRATLKMTEVLDETGDKLETARTLQHREYSEKDRGRDVTLIKYQTGVKIVRLYAPAVIVGVASIYCLTKSHGIMRERNAAITAAYIALDKGFRQYRARVIEKYGEEEDLAFRHGSEEHFELDEKGKSQKVVRVGKDIPSIYAKFFDETNPNWERDPEANLMYIHCQQQWANNRLRAKGHLFLNDVYDMLGMPRTRPGAVVGWVWDGEGDNFIDFGVFNGKTQQSRDFVNGSEGSILLDFNVDGLMYDKLDD